MTTHKAMFRVGSEIVEVTETSTKGVKEGVTELTVTDGTTFWKVGPDLLEKEYMPVSTKGVYYYEGITGDT